MNLIVGNKNNKKLTIWINYKNREHKKFKNIAYVTHDETWLQLWKQENINTFSTFVGIPIENIENIKIM